MCLVVAQRGLDRARRLIEPACRPTYVLEAAEGGHDLPDVRTIYEAWTDAGGPVSKDDLAVVAHVESLRRASGLEDTRAPRNLETAMASGAHMHPMMHLCLSGYPGELRRRHEDPASPLKAEAELAFELDETADGAESGEVFLAAEGGQHAGVVAE